MKLCMLFGILSVLTTTVFGPCDNHGPHHPIPPSKQELILEPALVPFQRDGSSAGLVANVEDSIIYNAPRAGDCTNPERHVHHWKVDSPDDYIEVTILDKDGIEPGTANALYYRLYRETPPNTNQVWTLKMEQIEPASNRLHQMSWRLQIGGAGEPDSEFGNGSDISPPVGNLPFARQFPADGRVGGRWILKPIDANSIRFIVVTLQFHVQNGNVEICN